jgi:Tol biopolymer transport system component
VAQRVGAGDRVVLVNRGYDARYVPTGHLVYGFQGQLFAIAFDAERLAVRGRAESVVQSLQPSTNGTASYGISDDGVLAYVRGAGAAPSAIVWVDRQGREVPVGAQERVYVQIRVSPDGSQLALGIGPELWMYSLGRGVMDRLTSVPAINPVWSPSGEDLVYYSDAVEGGVGLFRQSVNGSGPVERLATGNYVPMSWSRDRRYVLYLDFAANLPGSPPPDADLGLLTLDGARGARPLMKTPAMEGNSDLSPDGRWIAIESNELGGTEVFVRPFPDVDAGRWRISTAGGADPVWARDGHALYFREGQAIMEVSATGTNPAAWGRPVRLFEGDYSFSSGPRRFDVAPDGRFAMLKRVGGSDTSQPGVIVVLNWFDELKRLVPTK